MKIAGSGHISAGEYNDKISVSGSGKIDGNVRCVALSCSGAVKSVGSIECTEEVKVSGSAHFTKSVKASDLSASGSFRCDEDITAEKAVKISGSVKCDGSIKCSEFRCSGGVEIGKDVEADEIRISGRITCDGLLNAEKIEICLNTSASSRVGSIGGSSINVYRNDHDKESIISRMPLLSKIVGAASMGGLTVKELIEGDTVALECVTVPRVVGRVVAIGAGCNVDFVEYSEEIEIHHDAKVGRYEKV